MASPRVTIGVALLTRRIRRQSTGHKAPVVARDHVDQRRLEKIQRLAATLGRFTREAISFNGIGRSIF